MKNQIFISIPGRSIVAEIAHFTESVRRYLKTLLALLLRELELRKHEPIMSVLDIFEPVFILGTVIALKQVMDGGKPTYGGSVVLFYMSGFYPKYLWIACSRYMLQATRKRRFPAEQRLDYIFVHLICTFIEFVIMGLVAFPCVYFFITPEAIPFNFVPIIESLLAMVALSFGWGMINLTITRKIQIWRYMYMGINRTFIIISGAIFVPDFMPVNFRYWISFNPMLHGVALFRTGIYEQYPRLLLDKTYLAYWAVAAILIGLVLERVTRRDEAA